MDFAKLLPLAINVSLFLIVLGLGLKATLGDVTWLLRKPGLLVRSVVGMNIIPPLIAVAIAILFELHPAVEIALVLMAASPIPPALPGKLMKFIGNESYVYSLLVMLGLLSVVLLPLMMYIVGTFFGLELRVPPSLVFQLVLKSILLPLALGMVLRAIAPGVADRLSPIASTIGGILLPLAALPILIKAWPIVSSFATSGSIGAIIAMVLIGLALGHVFGGPDEENRTVLALATASRHPGIAIAVGHALFPDQRMVPVAVLLYLLVSALASLPYNIARKRRHHAPPGIPKPVGH